MAPSSSSAHTYATASRRNTPIEAILTEAYTSEGNHLIRGYERPGVEASDTEQVETDDAERPRLQARGPGAHTN
jgi:hypothetical protein